MARPSNRNAVPEPPIRDVLLIGGGGFAGSVLRYFLSTGVMSLTGSAAASSTAGAMRFPLGTLAVNAIGCLVIGVLGALGQHGQPWSPGARLFLFTGMLGGFTTFSAFGYETFELARTGSWGMAAANVLLQVVVGLAAVWCGYALAVRAA